MNKEYKIIRTGKIGTCLEERIVGSVNSFRIICPGHWNDYGTWFWTYEVEECKK